MDVTSLGWGVRSGLLEQPVEFTESVAAPVDVDDVDVVEEAVEDRAGALAESLADACPEAERRASGQGESAYDTNGSGGRERAEVVPVDLVPEGTLARLVEAGELEVDPAAVREEQPVEHDGEPALVRVLNGLRRADHACAARYHDPLAVGGDRTGPRPSRAPALGGRL